MWAVWPRARACSPTARGPLEAQGHGRRGRPPADLQRRRRLPGRGGLGLGLQGVAARSRFAAGERCAGGGPGRVRRRRPCAQEGRCQEGPGAACAGPGAGPRAGLCGPAAAVWATGGPNRSNGPARAAPAGSMTGPGDPSLAGPGRMRSLAPPSCPPPLRRPLLALSGSRADSGGGAGRRARGDGSDHGDSDGGSAGPNIAGRRHGRRGSGAVAGAGDPSAGRRARDAGGHWRCSRRDGPQSAPR
jgi:hypothetical protein